MKQRLINRHALACLILGLAALPLLGPIGAIVLAGLAESELARGGQLDGLGLARTGRILGWAGLVLHLCLGAAFLLWILQNGAAPLPYGLAVPAAALHL